MLPREHLKFKFSERLEMDLEMYHFSSFQEKNLTTNCLIWLYLYDKTLKELNWIEMEKSEKGSVSLEAIYLT